ncbi:Carbamoyl-phosphate synthase pyrimidine-specific large chain [Frankliniella fusca]|uniref:Carbamoyl-phosphate synthase pyrimidine-specific large chain n=1 Tax=Frankliniella fusca TaxID=407009 RepID=A0AAE1I0V2_9NEOP|nr:Carbamoyl-phosphate synthase pyrimidine-specific large chain [Frankliniella fusca]
MPQIILIELVNLIDRTKQSTQTTGRNVRNIGTQTIVEKLKSTEITNKQQPSKDSKQAQPYFISFEKCKGNARFQFFTGLDIRDFEALFELLGGDNVIRSLKQKYNLNDFDPRYSKVSGRDRLFLFLIRLRRGVPLDDLAEITGIGRSYLGDLLYIMTRHIYLTFKSMESNFFPTAAQQEKNKPKPFKPFRNLRIILDGAHFFTETPTNFEQQGNTYSLYKHHNTFVVVVGISCQGAVTFVSPAFEGNMSDKKAVLESGLLERLDEGDAVMTDRGFDIAGELLDIGVRLYKPPSLGDRNKLTGDEEILTKAIAAGRIYVEHIIADIKDNRLLQGVIPLLLLPVISDLIYIAGYLCNFKLSRIHACKKNIRE